MESCEVTCPTCFETFSIAAPPMAELPATIDYDCEVCCRPMMIDLSVEAEEVIATARSLDDL